MNSLSETLANAKDKVQDNVDEAIELYFEIVNSPKNDEESLKLRDTAALEVGSLLSKAKRANELATLIKTVREGLLSSLSKAKATKLIRSLLDYFLDLQAGTGQETVLCEECIDWAKKVNRNYLRQALEARLVALHFENGRFDEALRLAATLQKELKQMDDKALQAEVHLFESRTYYALGNAQKSRGSLTAARTATSGIYCPPRLQADFDMQSGIIHAADDRDFKTAYSYFYEAFEGYNNIGLEAKAFQGLKYMLLAKIVLNQADEVQQILGGKIALKYQSPELEAMRQIAAAYHRRSLMEFKDTLQRYGTELVKDPVIREHLNTVYTQLVEANLLRVLEPYERVELEHVARLAQLPLEDVQRTISRMILDKKLNGVIEQPGLRTGELTASASGVLVLYEASEKALTMQNSLELIGTMNKVVDALYHKAKKLTA